MAEEDEWKKLPTEDKVQHQSWKARAEGYKECIKKFERLDEKSPEFSKYLGLVKKFVIDTNELNRIQGLQAALLFVQNASIAGKSCLEVVSGVVAKCFNSKPRLREAGIEVCLMYIEIDRNEQVQDEIMKAFENKQPKIVHTCVEIITKALSLFGSKVIAVKPIIKPTIKLLDHRDKNVREAAKALFVEIYRWIGPAIRAPLQNINAVVLKELEDEWDKVGPGAQAKQTRFMRSQQDLREKMEAREAEEDGKGTGDADGDESAAVDAYDLLEAVDVLSKLPKNFYSQIEEKKWQERKMALEACEKLVTESPKLAAGDYGDLVKSLKKVLSKDTNILLVAIAIKSIGALAAGLRKKFQPYALSCLDGMFERFKEKKANVVAALQDAVDAIYLTTNLQSVSELVVEALGHKNPSIRCQVGLFLSRALKKTKSAALNKALMKVFVVPLCKNIDHSAPDVREAAFQAVGAMLKLVGETKLHPFIADLDKLKLDKINECAGKAELKTPKGSASTVSSSSQSVKSTSSSKSSSTQVKPEKKAATTSASKTTSKKNKPSAKKPSSTSTAPPTEQEIGDEVAEELVLKVISEEERSQILHVNWKERHAGLQSAFQKLRMLERSEISCQAFVKLLSIKPGWKDNNFNCLIERFKILAFLAENGSFSRTSASFCLLPTVDKIADVKGGASSKAALTAMSEATGMPWVAEQVLDHAMSQKNPKIQSESINWMSLAVREFGISGLNLKFVIDKMKTAISATNPNVRTSAFALIGTLTLFVGEKMRMFFESEKSTVLQQIDAEMEKVKGQSPPVPCRGKKKQRSSAAANETEEEEEEEVQEVKLNLEDMVTRVDISAKITDDLVNKLNDKNWKIRKDGLDSVVEILNEAKFVAADLGDLPTALKARLADSNKILVTQTLNILTQLSTSLGPHSAKHVSILSASLINALADSKPLIRQAALKCMDTWLENSKLSLWLEGDTIVAALSKTKFTQLRVELLSWLGEKLSATKKLPANAKENLELSVPVIYSCCEDRSGEVRAKGQAFLPVLMRFLSFDKLVRGTGKLSAASKNTIMPLLEKAREQLPPSTAPSKTSKTQPVKAPPPSSKQAPADDMSEPPEKATVGKERKSSKKEESRKRAPSTHRKPKASEEDLSPLFINLPNGKEQRAKDEAKLKTIKWHFAVPRDELVTQLQQQLATCIGSGLLADLFHADFQHHLKAISKLQQAITTDWEATLGCIDIILRWFTLRFYDKNTTVHIKSLEYLKALFDQLIATDYRLSEYEASAFLPHLIIKIGESKDNIRKAVHGILKQASLVYAASKLFNYIMDGIKSKNSRQRSECLDQIGLLIETYGVSVCQPTPAKALKEVATNISDRDKSVRLSALNAIVAAYNVSGDIVFKQVGRLNEKDMSMLEERIKRSGKYNEAAVRQPEQTAPSVSASTATKNIKETKSLPSDLAKSAPPIEKSSSAPEKMQAPEPFSDDDDVDDLIPDDIIEGISRIQEINVDHLLKPLPMPEFIKERGHESLSSTAGAALDVCISQVASTQLDSSVSAIHELYEVLKHKEKLALLHKRMDQLLTSCTAQIRMATDRYLPMMVAGASDENVSPDTFQSLCKSHFAFLLEIFASHSLCSQYSSYTIYDFLRTVMPLMVNEQFIMLPYSAKLTQILNILVLRSLDHCDPTAIACATVKLLCDSMESGCSSYFDIAIKCLWKMGRLIPLFIEPEITDGFRHKPLEVAALIAEIDRFWSTYPRGHEIYTTRIKTDVPLRSLKTIITNLCKQLEGKIFDELHMISNPNQSDVVAIIHKAMGTSARSHRSLSHKKENISGVAPVSLDMKLSGIFKKIGDRQQTKEGLTELYEFKQDHPHYDVDTHIEELEVEFFREYVKRGLRKIDEERMSKGIPQSRPAASCSQFNYHHDKEHISRLNRLRANCGLEPLDRDELSKRCGRASTTAADVNSNSKVLAPNTNTLNHPLPSSGRTKSATQLSHTTRPSSTAPPVASSTSSSLLDIKRRLEQIKQSSSRR